MAVKKDYYTIELKSAKLKAAIVIFVILAVCFLTRLTPLIHYYWVNLLTALVVSNGISLLVIAGLLMALHIVDVKRFKEMLKKEDKSNVH
ncbi:hypothetical protein DWY01_05415 [Eubacterium sp. AF22-8LB]|uniref:hypothetical protein n=1 Tax=Eubacterium sp. AF22-8LB TaxID=2292232 RepID=UPI000E49FA33|nr:hypothetical protein [Eubacterium sp. AF22-8LB]RGS30891.1 hypothetical protein DWY01_05415 [Eubacterium sp. AF22-8LB]